MNSGSCSQMLSSWKKPIVRGYIQADSSTLPVWLFGPCLGLYKGYHLADSIDDILKASLYLVYLLILIFLYFWLSGSFTMLLTYTCIKDSAFLTWSGSGTDLKASYNINISKENGQ